MKIPPWSYSLLSCYETCPHQCYRRYVAKDVPFRETPEMRRGNEVHESMELRVRDRTPLPEDCAAYEPFAAALDPYEPKLVEEKFGVTAEGRACGFFDKDVWGRGKLDVVVVNFPGGHAGIVDWKTGKVREDPAELRVQAVLLQARYPVIARLSGNYVWLAEGRIGTVYDLSDTAGTWRRIGATVCEMGEREDEPAAWEKTPGPLCAWCGVKDCEHNRNKNL